MPRTIPEIREKLHEIANHLAMPGFLSEALHALADETKRRPPVHFSRRKLFALTPERVKELKEFTEANPEYSYKELAELFDTGVGRISEALAGKR